jgi:hypothetical protein
MFCLLTDTFVSLLVFVANYLYLDASTLILSVALITIIAGRVCDVKFLSVV